MTDNTNDINRLTDAVNKLASAKRNIDDALTDIADRDLSDEVNSLYALTKQVIESIAFRIAQLRGDS